MIIIWVFMDVYFRRHKTFKHRNLADVAFSRDGQQFYL